MRALLSTIGSRGDVQPLIALGMELAKLGHEARICVPPDFIELVKGFGLPCVAIGPQLRQGTMQGAPASPPTPEQGAAIMSAMVSNQFETLTRAADGCDGIVGATALQISARSVAELRGIPYIFVAYCPVVLPSSQHAPPPLIRMGDTTAPMPAEYPALWQRDAERFNMLFAPALNSERVSRGLAAVADVRAHVFSDRPWLAADPMLAPWPADELTTVFQAGAWIAADTAPLPVELEVFLDAGEPPVYFGFGSMTASEDVASSMIEAARQRGLRAVLSRGWADWTVANAPDCITVGDLNHRALFGRVAAVVHHGGAGTTAAAAGAAAPQVVVPQLYDQYYWAQRVDEMGIGARHRPGPVSTESIRAALGQALHPDVVGRAADVASRMRDDGAAVAARELISRLKAAN